MKPAAFMYRRPDSLAECVELLGREADAAKVIAGGQSLMPMLNMRLASPEIVIDISRVGELRQARQLSEGCAYGSCIVHSSFEDNAVPDVTNGLMSAAAAGIGYRAIRNRGTIGGSMAHADASAEWPVVLAAADATLLCRSSAGERTVPARGFIHGYFTSALQDDEVLVQVQVPAFGAGRRWGLYKLARKLGEFADSIGVVVFDAERADTPMRDVEVWLGGAGDTPRRLASVVELLSKRAYDQVGKRDVLDAVTTDLPGARSAEERYRVQVHAVTIWRALGEVSWDQTAG